MFELPKRGWFPRSKAVRSPRKYDIDESLGEGYARVNEDKRPQEIEVERRPFAREVIERPYAREEIDRP